MIIAANGLLRPLRPCFVPFLNTLLAEVKTLASS